MALLIPILSSLTLGILNSVGPVFSFFRCFEDFSKSFKKYLLNKGVNVQNEEDIILGFDNLESWLNEMDSRLSQRFLTQVSQRYPAIANKIKFWNRPDDWKPSGRGRKPGSKNKPKSDDLTFTQVSVSEPETMVGKNEINHIKNYFNFAKIIQRLTIMDINQMRLYVMLLLKPTSKHIHQYG